MGRIRKIVVRVPFDERYKDFFDKIERYELLQIHRLDDQVIIATQLFKFKDSSFQPKDLLGINGIEFIEILTEDKAKNEYICFVKHRWPKELQDFFSDPEIIMNAPITTEGNSLLISFTVDSRKANKVWEELQRFGSNFKIVSVTTLRSSHFGNPALSLTERQREIAFYAVEEGYYDIPRKINTNDLAKRFGISQSALSEHLRRIERTIFHSLFK
jgi:DNA-binding CsgD family transcriptional regulator